MNKNITIGEKYGPAMEITDQDEADAYFEECVQHSMSWGNDREEAEQIERLNFGYYAGYYDGETMERVNRLFCTEHPIFGRAIPASKEAYVVGFDQGIRDYELGDT